MAAAPEQLDQCVLVFAPSGRDGPMMAEVLGREGFCMEVCADVEQLCHQAIASAGCAVVAEEALTPHALRCIGKMLAQQPPWSDLPLVILTGGGKTTPESMRVINTLAPTANVTLLERPVRIVTLTVALRAALRSRKRQYEVRDLLATTQDAVRQRDRFLAILGHELRNPVGAIRTATEVLDQIRSDDELVAKEQREIVRRQAAQIARLVDDLLDVSRVTSGKIVLQLKPVDLRDVAARCLQALRALIDTGDHDITLTLPQEPVVVNGDSVRLEQILINLLTNAVKYTPPPGKIAVVVSAQDGEAVLRVTDTGLGIPPEMLPRVFEPFVQDDHSLDRSAGGLGIGLTVVRSLVEMHGGSIVAHSAGRGKGSEFVVRFPVFRQAEAPGETPPPTSPSVLRRVLVVEDGADARRAMRTLLRLWGHEVELADDGRQGLEKAIAFRPDVALVDIGLPGLDGYEVARRIRAALGREIMLVALTGYGQPEDRARAKEAGFDIHLVKPVDPQRLRQLLSDANDAAPSASLGQLA